MHANSLHTYGEDVKQKNGSTKNGRYIIHDYMNWMDNRKDQKLKKKSKTTKTKSFTNRKKIKPAMKYMTHTIHAGKTGMNSTEPGDKQNIEYRGHYTAENRPNTKEQNKLKSAGEPTKYRGMGRAVPLA